MEHIDNLQTDFCNLVAWSKEWQMDLGVIISADLKWEKHCSGCCKQCASYD